jgi:hypothetical protein
MDKILGKPVDRHPAAAKIKVMTRRRKDELFVLLRASRASARVMKKMVNGSSEGAGSPLHVLTDRELEAHWRIGRGSGTRRIAEDLRSADGNQLRPRAIQWVRSENNK